VYKHISAMITGKREYFIRFLDDAIKGCSDKFGIDIYSDGEKVPYITTPSLLYSCFQIGSGAYLKAINFTKNTIRVKDLSVKNFYKELHSNPKSDTVVVVITAIKNEVEVLV